jgi:signal transduction histidine kinase
MPLVVRRFLAHRDVLLALALCAGAEFELATGATYAGRPVWPGPRLQVAVLIPMLTLPMAARRRRPLLTCVSVLVAIAVLSAALGGGEATSEFVLFIAVVFSGAAYTDRQILVATAALVAGTVHALRDPSVHGFGDAVWMLGMLAIAFLIGRAVRARQVHIGVLQDEAVQREARHRQQVAAATAAERAAIARKLHDIVAHAVSVVVIQAQAGARALPANPDVAAGTLATIEDSARTALADLRRLLTVLGDDDASRGAAPMGSLAQLDELVQTFAGSGVDVTLDMGDALPQLTPAAELAAYRVVQEALTNAARYARGSHVAVTVSIIGGNLELRVVNIGGTPAAGVSDLGAGRGLIGMRARLDLVGGRLVTAEPTDSGYQVHACIPVAENELVAQPERVTA